jgi:hypothetical protein
MKKTTLMAGLMAALVAGCAHEKAQFSGHDYKTNPADVEKLLAETAPPIANPIHNFAVIRAVVGNAEFSADGGTTWKPAAVGVRLGANSVIRTEQFTKVDLYLGENGPVVRLLAETQMGIERLDFKNTAAEKIIDTNLRLDRGKMLGNVKKMAAASRFVVRTPTSLVFIRGTEFSVSASGQVGISSGLASVAFGGKRFEVNNGEKFEPGRGVHRMNAKEQQADFEGPADKQ